MVFSTTVEPALRARLWLTADEVGEHDADPRLWLHLNDGRVLAFRLAETVFGDDRVLAPLTTAIAEDLRGMRSDNAEIATALDADAPLAARIVETTGHFGDPWQRMTFAIETVPLPGCTKLAA